jgi:hypothetical protein
MTQQALKQSAVTPNQIEQLIAMRETQRSLKERLTLMDDAIHTAQEAILGALDAGADLSYCPYSLSIQVQERRYPKWRDEFVSRLGKTEADQILANTTATVYRKLVIK